MRGVSTPTAGRRRCSCLGRHSGRSTESRQGQVGRPGTKPPPGCAMSTPCQRIRGQLPCAGDGFDAVGGAKLVQEVADVLFDGVEGNHQIGGDGLVLPARGEHPKHLQCHANGVHAQRYWDGTFVPRPPRKIPPRRHVWLTPGTPGLPSVKRTETRTDRRTRMATLKTGSLETGASTRDQLAKRPDVTRLATPIDKAIAYGCNAPNPHNSQAWKLRNTSDLQTVPDVDKARLLPVTDLPARQIHIGCGRSIETLPAGASTMGFGTAVESSPKGTYGLIGGRQEAGRPHHAHVSGRNPAR